MIKSEIWSDDIQYKKNKLLSKKLQKKEQKLKISCGLEVEISNWSDFY